MDTEPARIFITGVCEKSDYPLIRLWLQSEVDHEWGMYTYGFELGTGDCDGPEVAVREFAQDYKIPLVMFPRVDDPEIGRRNALNMAEWMDSCLVFWDGVQRSIGEFIRNLVQFGKNVEVVSLVRMREYSDEHAREMIG